MTHANCVFERMLLCGAVTLGVVGCAQTHVPTDSPGDDGSRLGDNAAAAHAGAQDEGAGGGASTTSGAYGGPSAPDVAANPPATRVMSARAGAGAGDVMVSGTGGVASEPSRAGATPATGEVYTARACVVQAEPSPQSNDACQQLRALVLERYRITDESGDGLLSPGESATVSVTWREVLGIGANLYPGVTFSTPNEGVVVDESDFRYAALPCRDEELSTRLSLSRDIPAHSRVTVKAQIGSLGPGCSTGDSLEFSFSVGDPLP